jgi:3-oxoacyl-[acyl-carrier protein] reductase
MLNGRSDESDSAQGQTKSSNSLDLSGQVAIVTGGARGLGRCEAEILAARGAHVVVADIIDPSETTEAIGAAGGSALAVQLDLAASGAAEEVMRQALVRWGDVDLVVNNAGIVHDGMSFNLSPSHWQRVIAVNLDATFLLSRLAARHWRDAHRAGDARSRAIVNTTSESGLYGNAGQANYAAAKAGVVALTLTLAAELDRYLVRVNAIAPRARTSMSSDAFGDLPLLAGDDPFAPEPVADVVAWLLSGAAEHVTGQVFVAHGHGIEVMAGWSSVRRISRSGRWTDAELSALSQELFDGSPRHLPRPVSELFLG